MIFNKEYDESLYLILKYDKKNRKDIVRLLKYMPKDFYSYLLNELDKNDVKCSTWQNDYYNCKYMFNIDKNQGIITINMEDKKMYDKLELSISKYNLINGDIISSSLGSFSKKVLSRRKKDNKVIEHEKIYKYDMMNMPKEKLFYKVKDTKKIISSFPMIREIKENDDIELTLRYINQKFNKKNK